jgi:anti-sigma B factor antagonist
MSTRSHCDRVVRCGSVRAICAVSRSLLGGARRGGRPLGLAPRLLWRRPQRGCVLTEAVDAEVVVASTETGELLITVRGDLDMASVPQLEAEVRGRRPFRQPLLFDLSEVTFFDSGAVRALLAARRAANDDGGFSVCVVAASPVVRKVLEVTGVAEVFLFRESDSGS